MLAVLRRWRRRAVAKQSRDPRWDNLRYLSGTLVVLVHMSNGLTDRMGLHWLYVATWALRVPLFAMVAGYFSRADAITPREARRLVESILVPYLALSLLHTLQIWHFRGRWTFFVTEPAWGLWFLLSLLCWRAALPYLAQLRHPLATCVVVALVAGYIPDIGTTMSVSRTLTFLPFFLVGWKLRQGVGATALRTTWSRYVALAVLAATFAVSWLIHDNVKANWLRMKGPYDGGQSLLEAPWAWVVRAVVLVGGAVIALSFARLVPHRRLPAITYLGAGGMYIYLLHPLVLRPLNVAGVLDWVGPWHEQVLLVGCAFALTAVLASAPVRWVTRPVVQPRLPWLFRGETAPSPASAPTPVPAGVAPTAEQPPGENLDEKRLLAGR